MNTQNNTLSNLVIKIDTDAIIAQVSSLVGKDQIAAFEHYTETRAGAIKMQKLSGVIRDDAQYLENVMNDNFRVVIADPAVKDQLRIAYAQKTEQTVHDGIRELIIAEIVAQDERFANYVVECGNKGLGLLKHIQMSADEAKAEAMSMFKDADQTLRNAGLGQIVIDRDKARSEAKKSKK